jgi:hypothetical protein
MEYETISPSHLYGGSNDMGMNMHLYQQQYHQEQQQLQQLQQQQHYIPPHHQQHYQGSSGITGLRHYSYQVAPDISSSPYFVPEIQSTMAFQSGNLSSRKADNNPSCGETDKEQQDSFVPSKKKNDTHEDKKNLATMVNVFASSTSTTTEKASTIKTSKIDSPKHTTTATVDKPPIDNDIMNLLISDMSELNVEEEENTVTASPAPVIPFAKPGNSKPSSPRNQQVRSHALYPNDKRSTITTSTSLEQQHQQLLTRISKWVNNNYKKKQTDSIQRQSPSTTLHVA